MQPVFIVIYIAIEFAQYFAVYDVFHKAVELPMLLAVFVSMIVAYIPLLGTGIGVYGAVTVWDWSWIAAALLFFWFVPVGAIFLMIDRIRG